MSREAHVRFCESLGLQRPGPLTEASAQKKYGVTKPKKAKKAKKASHNGRAK
jgi:hypothetical protein